MFNSRCPPARAQGLRRLLIALAWLAAAATPAAVQAWSLTDAQRRAYLYHYAPLILKQANESDSEHWGWDWITNFDYDRDGNFSNNLEYWRTLGSYVANPGNPSFANWKIRPTVYSALLEFQEGDAKSLILLYHVYHAQELNNSIHDWERVEVRIDQTSGTPGGGAEVAAYVLVTEHKNHVALRAGSKGLNFTPPSAWGHHPIVWQAEWAEDTFSKNELHHVTSTWSSIANALTCNTCAAEVKVKASDTEANSTQEVHYVFVPEADAEAVALWNARALSHDTAASLAAKSSSTLPNWAGVKRITYELQDLADILPTHAQTSSCLATPFPTEHGWAGYATQWDTDDEPSVGILLDTPLTDEAGAVLVPASSACGRPVTFWRYSRDTTDTSDGAQGYPYKHWFWGAYVTNSEQETDHAFDGTPMVDPTRGNTQVRNCSAGLGEYWCQHDYYAHTGKTRAAQHGKWLPLNWQLPAAGGFDGRWVQLFPDNH